MNRWRGREGRGLKTLSEREREREKKVDEIMYLSLPGEEGFPREIKSSTFFHRWFFSPPPSLTHAHNVLSVAMQQNRIKNLWGTFCSNLSSNMHLHWVNGNMIYPHPCTFDVCYSAFRIYFFFSSPLFSWLCASTLSSNCLVRHKILHGKKAPHKRHVLPGRHVSTDHSNGFSLCPVRHRMWTRHYFLYSTSSAPGYNFVDAQVTCCT